MTTTLTTFDVLCLDIDEHVGELAYVSVLADWLEERGDERVAGLRWLVREEKVPMEEARWYWWRDRHYEAPLRTKLPLEIVRPVHGGWYDLHKAPSVAYLVAATDLVKQGVAK